MARNLNLIILELYNWRLLASYVIDSYLVSLGLVYNIDIYTPLTTAKSKTKYVTNIEKELSYYIDNLRTFKERKSLSSFPRRNSPRFEGKRRREGGYLNISRSRYIYYTNTLLYIV